MPVVRYTATRSVVSPASPSEVIVFNLPIAYAGMTRSRLPNVVKHRSLTGAQAAYYHSVQYAWDIVTYPLLWAQGVRAADLEMFLDSVEGGEYFEFDPEGFAGGSITYQNVVMDSTGHSAPRRQELDSRFTYTFRIITVP